MEVSTANSIAARTALYQSLEIDFDVVPLEQISVYTAVQYWLTAHDDPPIGSSVEQEAFPCLQALGCLQYLQDWKRAKIVENYLTLSYPNFVFCG